MPKSIHALLICLLFAASTRAADKVPPTEFMSGDAAKAAIVDDSLDPYFARLCPHEMSLKTGSPITGDTPADRVTECKKRYQAAVMDFTDQEKADLQWVLDGVQPALVKNYPVFGNTPFSFIKVAKSLEGGMPHTRGTHIVIPQELLPIVHQARSMKGDRGLKSFANLLVHEQTHVVERLHPDLFVPLFTDVFHFVHAKKIKTDQWLDDRQLINPDGTVCDWVMPVVEKPGQEPTYVLPLVEFGHTDSTGMVEDFTTVAVTLVADGDGYKPKESADGTPEVRPLSQVPGYFKDIGHIQDDYHPNEVAADWMANLAVFDTFTDLSKVPEASKKQAEAMDARLKPVREWAKKAFAEPAKK